MRQLQRGHFLLFRLLKEHCLFLTRKQIERVLTLATRASNKELSWLVEQKYLDRRYRADTFVDFQRPLYYLGTRGWRMCGSSPEGYKAYRTEIEQRHGQGLTHLLCLYDVLLKFLLESNVKRMIRSEDKFWHESLSFELIPDAWVQFGGGEAFIEVDRGTEGVEVVKQKFEKYARLKRFGNYAVHFPGCQFRILFITTTEERIGSLEEITSSDDIWFTTMDEFLKETLNHRHWSARFGFYALPVAPKEKV